MLFRSQVIANNITPANVSSVAGKVDGWVFPRQSTERALTQINRNEPAGGGV